MWKSCTKFLNDLMFEVEWNSSSESVFTYAGIKKETLLSKKLFSCSWWNVPKNERECHFILLKVFSVYVVAVVRLFFYY